MTTGRQCALTGLSLVPPPSGTVFRVSETGFGPLNPRRRSTGGDRGKWGRWDTAAGRTLYAGSTPTAAFAEVLPYGRENLPAVRLADLFDDVADDEADQLLATAVRSEMPGPTLRDTISRDWCGRRALYELRLASHGWFVDVHSAESLAAVSDALGSTKPADRLTLGDLTGENRNLTTRIASWIRTNMLDDGSHPLGVRYLSKHGANLHVFAVWLRALDDGKPLTSEATRVVSTQAFNGGNPDLKRAAAWSGLTVL